MPTFVDVNVPMYAAGADHPLKAPCVAVLEAVAEHPDRFFTDSECFQELIHRYRSQRRWQSGRRVFDAFEVLMSGRVAAVGVGDVSLAAQMTADYPTVDTRDLVHAAVMRRLGSVTILSSDAGYDAIDGLARLSPDQPGVIDY
ncbi:MAG: PIN domain-containing protein [Dehalococcoidia bacterium]|nr:PIN domain-containing protein [Dehalococcoidia bacterium]